MAEKFYVSLNNILLWLEGPGLSFFKKYWKIGLIIILALLLLKTCNEKANLKNQVTAIRKINNFEKQSLENTVKYWKDQAGEEHATVEKTLGDLLVNNEYYDSLSSLLRIKPKNLQAVAVTRTVTKINAPLTIKTIFRDTCFDKNGETIIYNTKSAFSWSDPWTNVSGTLNQNTYDKDSIHIQSIDTLTAIDYWQRSRILGLRIGKIRGYIDYTNANPHNKITGAKKFEITPPKYKWSLGLSANLGYPILQPLNQIDLKKPTFTIGISLQRQMIKF